MQGLHFPVLCPASPISSGSAVLCPEESPRFERRKKKIRFPQRAWLRMRMPSGAWAGEAAGGSGFAFALAVCRVLVHDKSFNNC